MSGAVNDKQLLKALRDMKKIISPREIRHILGIAASPLVDELKLKAPMKIIRDDLGIVSNPSKYPRSIMVGLTYDKGASSNLAYAFEYGTAERFTKDGEYRGKIDPPRPFFRPTVDRMRAQIVTNMKAELFKLVTNKLK